MRRLLLVVALGLMASACQTLGGGRSDAYVPDYAAQANANHGGGGHDSNR